MVLDRMAGEMGATPMYDSTDLLVTLDFNECEEFLRTSAPDGCVSLFSTRVRAFSVLIVNLFSFLRK